MFGWSRPITPEWYFWVIIAAFIIFAYAFGKVWLFLEGDGLDRLNISETSKDPVVRFFYKLLKSKD